MEFVEFIEGEKFAAKDANISDRHDSFKDAGIKLTDDDLVVDIDCLNQSQIIALINTFNIRTQTVWTDRGVHFYFLKPKGFRGAKAICPLGFEVEYKHTGNTKAVTVKRNGVLRNIENEGNRESLPDIFTNNAKYEDLTTYGAGDGRNNALFKHKAKIGSFASYTTMLNFINNYIFAEPLDQKEFETVTRNTPIVAEKNQEYHVAGRLLNVFDFLKYGSNFYFKVSEQEYSCDERMLRKEIFKILGATTTRYIDEVVKQMQYRCREIPNDTIFKIKFNNGYLYEGQFYELITEDFTPYHIEVEYKPDAKPVPIVDNYINHLTNSDPDYRNLLLEVLAHTLIVNPEFKRAMAQFFIFEGKGGNGKGTLLQIIKTILGAKNVSGMSMSELTDERYLSSFKGKLANLGDDLQDAVIDDKAMKILKNISTCDYISTRELYKQAEQMIFTGTLIFTSNHAIKSWEKGESYKRRVKWLPMFTKVKEKDPLFISKLTTPEALEYWIRLILEGYFRLYQNGKFTESEIVNQHNEKYHRENNPALDFLDNYDYESILGQPIAEVYETYKQWCEDNGFPVKSSNKMIRETIEEQYDLGSKAKRINGKVTRCFLPLQ
mgnify:FL=1